MGNDHAQDRYDPPGVGSDFDPSFFESSLFEGKVPTYNDTLASPSVLLSKKISDFSGLL